MKIATIRAQSRQWPRLKRVGGRGKIGCRLVQEPVDETRESVSIGELAVTPGARDAAALENDEFDDLLLEVIVFGQA